MSKKGKIPIHKPKTLTEFSNLDKELNRRGFIALDALKPGFVRTLSLANADSSQEQAKDMAACIGSGGSISNGPLAKVVWSFDSHDATPAAAIDKDGKQLGRGYVKWGPGDNLPNQIYAYAMALPYTAAPLRYLSDLATGLGIRYMYRFPDGTTCEFSDAGERLLREWEELGGNKPEADGGVSAAVYSITGETTAESVKASRAREAYEDWKRTWYGYNTMYKNEPVHVPMAKEFLENNDLDLHLSQCMQDFMMYDLCFPTVGLQRGRAGVWDPKIVRVGFLSIPHGGIRYEAMNEYRHIEHVYFGEMFRQNTKTSETIGESHDVKMYPVAEQRGRVGDLRQIVKDHKRARIKDRPTWVVCPIAYGTRNYYQQPAWWSIFTSKAFDFSSTILYDKAKARENSTSWGKVIYISLDYLDKVYADAGIGGDTEKQTAFIEELDNSIEQFLQRRENNGKMMRQYMWVGQDGKEHHNVEIVDVAETANDVAKAGKEELELSTNPIFLAFGVDPRDVGVPMVQASNGGTALREIRLMKQQLLNVRQQAFIRLLESISTFNGFSERGFWRIKQQTFTTLDNSKTGMVETTAGGGA